MESYVYKLDEKFLANSTVNPENKCFDSEFDLPGGVFDSTACQPLGQPKSLKTDGARVFFSQPHFYQGDQSYLDYFNQGGVKNMRPDKARHETAFRVEPKTGLTQELVARFQINFIVTSAWEHRFFPALPTAPDSAMIPVFWQELKFELPVEFRSQVWLLVALPTLVRGTGIVFLLVSLVLASLVGLHIWNVKFDKAAY